MQIDIHTRHLDDPAELRRDARARLTTAFARFAARIRRVRVVIEDVNGPRGGVDKRCRIEVDGLAQGPPVFVADADQPFAALGRAVERARRWVARAAVHPRRPARGATS